MSTAGRAGGAGWTSGVDPQLLDGIRRWLGEGPGARRLSGAEVGPTAVYAGGVEEAPHLPTGDGGAVVVVLDGELPLGSDELTMLAELPAPPTAVVFALAGAQEGDPAGESLCARNRALLASYTPGLEAAPMVPVGRGPGGSLRLAAAIEAVERRLEGVDRLAETAASAVDFEAARQRRRLAALARDPEFESLRAERAAMLRTRHGSQAHAGGGLSAQLAGLRAAFGLARVDLGHEIASRGRHLASAVRTELDAATKDDLRGFPDRLRDGLAAVGAELDRDVDGRLRAVYPGLPAGRAEGPEPVIAEPRGRSRGFDDRLMIVMGASGGLGLGRLLTTPLQVVGLPELLSVPIMLLLGATLAWWIVRARANAGDRQRMRQWAGEAIAERKARWERNLAQRALDAEAAAVGALSADHARAVADADRRLAAVEERLSRLGRAREGKARAVKNRLAQATRLRAALAPHIRYSENREGTAHVDV